MSGFGAAALVPQPPGPRSVTLNGMDEPSPRATILAGTRVEWELDAIVRDGERVKVEPRHMRVLAGLLARRGTVVARDELLGEAWPDVVVEDEALTQSISALRRALGDDARNPRVIETVPKKGYRLIGTVEDAVREGTARPALRPESAFRRRAAAALAGIGVAAALWTLSAVVEEPPAGPLRAVAETSYAGREAEPALSPNGRNLAFVWDGPERRRFDLWIKPVGAETSRRLTDTPELETGPAWSADGRSVFFARVGEGTCEVVSLSIGSGAERRLAGCGRHAYPQLAASPDGRTLAFSDSEAPSGGYRIFLLALRSGAPTPLTGPVTGYGDRFPAFSPDGRTLAFLRTTSLGASDVYVVPAAGGEPRHLTDDGTWAGGVTWTTGGDALIASSSRGGMPGLWRVPVRGGRPRWLGVPAEGAVRPALEPATGTLVFERQDFDSDVWALVTSGPWEPRRVIASTRRDGAPEISPDGRRVAFVSDRSGNPELWLAGVDGSNPHRLSDLGAARMLPPRWAPDGRSLAVTAARGSHGDLFLVEVASGRARRVAPSAANELAPAFSADGSDLFFMSDRGGAWRLWRVGLAGGAPQPVSDLPLASFFATPDGAALYASRYDRDGLWRVPLDGGAPVRLAANLAAGRWGDWSARRDVLLFVDRADRMGSGATLRRLDAQTGAVTTLGPIPISEDDRGLTVSPDGRTVLFTRWDRSQSDLFRVASVR